MICTHGSFPIGLISDWARFKLGSTLIAFLPNDLPIKKWQAVKQHLDNHVRAELETSRVYIYVSMYIWIYTSTDLCQMFVYVLFVCFSCCDFVILMFGLRIYVKCMHVSACMYVYMYVYIYIHT